MKKKLLYIAAMLICLSIMTGGTLAYYTTSDTARNVITSDGVKVQVVEQQMVGGTSQPYPNQPIPVMPTDTVSKIVAVRNEDQPAWVRMRYTVTVHNPQGEVMNFPAGELSQAIVITPDSSSWTLKDGWWYYNTHLKSGEVSTPLFEEVFFSGPHMDNKYQLCTVTIDVTAQAVQKVHNGTSVMEALGWPET